ncbi:hypothetical protein PR048_005288 [Dryococelus australis]|uniref:Uncharacterized protein n=1 Tax=Dryococelus australis TaxID=614101 RepID=A0ABQ9I7S9_9NEOP|nr:hypothetical protein PR048_005288 [Dryococelus australis]
MKAIEAKLLGTGDTNGEDQDTTDCEILQLKGKQNATIYQREEIILAALPKSFTLKKMQNEFKVLDYTERLVKNLVKEKDILCSPNPKPQMTLDSKTAEKVQEFYVSDEISHVVPGKNPL